MTKGQSLDNSPQDLYTVATLATFAGSSGAVLILYNTFRRLFNRESVWAAFLLSMVVSFVVALATGSLKGPLGFFLAFLNGCLLFSSAAGAQQALASQPPGQPSPREVGIGGHPDRPIRFFSSWFGHQK